MPPSGPAARCDVCHFTWNSAGMVEGLRLLGSCPRCGSDALVFRDADAPLSAATVAPRPLDGPGGAPVAPHLVLGLPRR